MGLTRLLLVGCLGGTLAFACGGSAPFRPVASPGPAVAADSGAPRGAELLESSPLSDSTKLAILSGLSLDVFCPARDVPFARDPDPPSVALPTGIPPDFRISLRESGGMILNVVDVVVDGGGQVTVRRTDDTGTAEERTRVETDRIVELVALVYRRGFFASRSYFSIWFKHHDGGGQAGMVTDARRITLKVRSGGRTKRVVHVPVNPTSPLGLYEIERAVFSLGGQAVDVPDVRSPPGCPN